MQNSAGNDGTSKDTIDIINITSNEEAKKLLVSEAEAAKIKLDDGEESKKSFPKFLNSFSMLANTVMLGFTMFSNLASSFFLHYTL